MSLFSTKFFADMDREYKAAKAAIPNRDTEIKYILLARQGSAEALRLIAGLCYPTIVSMATGNPRYRRFKGDYGELVSEVMLHLPKAIDDFDLNEGTRFITFFNARIFNALNKAIFADNLVQWPENRLRAGETVTAVAFAAPGPEQEKRPNAPVMDILLNHDDASDIADGIDLRRVRSILKEQASAALESDAERQLFDAMLSPEWNSAADYASRTGNSTAFIRRVTKTVITKMRNRTVLMEAAEEIL